MGLFYRIDWTIDEETPVGITFFRNRNTAAYFTRQMLGALTSAHGAEPAPIKLPKGAFPVGSDRAVAVGRRVLLTPSVTLGKLLIEEHGDIPPGFLINRDDVPELWQAALETTGKAPPRVILRDFTPDPISIAERQPYPRARHASAAPR